jgi:hypothetical protein
MNKTTFYLVIYGVLTLVNVALVVKANDYQDRIREYKAREAETAAAIEACSAEHNVHLASCEMQAVVVKGRDLLPFPAEGEGQ